MDARAVKEISLRVRSLTKAVDEKQPIPNIIAILESLQKDVVPTEELLRVCFSLDSLSDSSRCGVCALLFGSRD
jgi:hypothetical protein